MSEPLPLIIGVTGHRDLLPDEVPQLTQKIEGFFSDLSRQYPDLPLLVMSGAAAGADTLVVHTAAKLGHTVMNVLPMPYDEYAKDFDAQGQAELSELITQHETLTLPTAPEEFTNNRDRLYERAGIFIASHCHILLALWDGKQKKAVGGTSTIVQFHQSGISSLSGLENTRSRIDVADDESDLVHHIVCSRVSDGAPQAPLSPSESYWYTRDEIAPRTAELPPRYQAVLQRMSLFNKDLFDAGADGDDNLFDVADKLAQVYQRKTLWTLRTTIGAALAAGLSFIIYADLLSHPTFMAAYFLFVALALGSYRLAQRKDWQRRYLDYRLLAESLRVQHFWSKAGVQMARADEFAHDQLMRGRDLELGWIRNAMRHAGLRSNAQTSKDDAALQDVIEHWIDDPQQGQVAYFIGAVHRKTKQHQNNQRWITICFIATLMTSGILALGGSTIGDTVGDWLIGLTGLLPLIAAARQNYAYRRAERELLGQFGHMKKIFLTAAHLLDQATSNEEKRIILRDLGEAAMAETGEWILRQRERPLPGGEPLG